ncbi:MAG: hypothetical protein IMF17_02220, partial [Proteobacteria bacterium]|nr:hypothetical protein [Pseudomonadota bacterium]
QLGQQFLTLEHSMAGEFTEMNKKATALNANYNSTSDEALQLFKDFEQKRIDALNKYRDLMFAVRSEVSEKEWKVLIN